MSHTIYLASPYGFSEQWKRLLLPEFVDALTALGWRFGSLFRGMAKLILRSLAGLIALRKRISKMFVMLMRSLRS
jgi:hypothetical protein